MRPVEADLFHVNECTEGRQADRQTDMTKLTGAFRNIANALKEYVRQIKTD